MSSNACQNEPENYRATALPRLVQPMHEHGDVRDGLLATPKSLPSRYFYDERGSKLFERICDTPEYYPTRTEQSLLDSYAGEIMALAQPAHLIEFGSGSSRKTRSLLAAWPEQLNTRTYWPLDVSEEILQRTGKSLAQAFPAMTVHALVGDYTQGLERIPRASGPRLAAFLGGTIGNFTASEAEGFLREIAAHLEFGDCLLLGADRVKAPDILHQAYNDKAGLTEAFNLNLLRVLNRELGANFDVGAFAHRAIYASESQQVEMYLVSAVQQTVTIPALNLEVEFMPGERVRTEISRKFTKSGLTELLNNSDYHVMRFFEPDDAGYSLVLARRER